MKSKSKRKNQPTERYNPSLHTLFRILTIGNIFGGAMVGLLVAVGMIGKYYSEIQLFQGVDDTSAMLVMFVPMLNILIALVTAKAWHKQTQLMQNETKSLTRKLMEEMG